MRALVEIAGFFVLFALLPLGVEQLHDRSNQSPEMAKDGARTPSPAETNNRKATTR